MADGTAEPGVERGIAGLQERLDELRRNVELLGTQGVWAPQGANPEPAPAPYAPAAPVAPPIPAPSQQVPPTQPPPAYAPPEVPAPVPVQAAAVTSPDPAAPAPAAYRDAFDAPAVPPTASGSPATVAHVDAGPFADLVELRHFEDDLVGLTAVDEVRVRRFGRGRAAIEVGMAGPYDLALELPRLGLPMDVGCSPDGGLVIEFAPPVPEASAGAAEPVGADATETAA